MNHSRHCRRIPAITAYTCLLYALLALLISSRISKADIYRWDDGTVIAGSAGITLGPGIDLSGWNTPDHNLEYADLTINPLSLAGATFANTDLSYARLGATPGSNGLLTNTNFNGAVILGIDLTRIAGDLENFTSAQLYSTASYAAKNLSGVNFTSGSLSNWNFANQNLSNANFAGATLTGTVFTHADIRGVNFSRISNGLALTSTQLYSTASYIAGDLTGVNFSGTKSVNANLAGWSFVSQNLTGCNFTYCNLSGANLSASNLSLAVVTGANFSNTVANGLTRAQLFSTANCLAGNLAGVNLSSNDLGNWDFSGLNLAGVSFTSSNLAGADFTNAVVHDDTLSTNFSGATSHGFTADQLYSTASYKSKNLSGINLSGNNLVGWDFSGQNISRADLSNSGLSPAQFYSTASYASGTVSGVNLSSDDLSGWDFSGKNMQGVNFSSANLTGASFAGTLISGSSAGLTQFFKSNVSQDQIRSTASYAVHDLSYINFGNTDLSGVDLSNQRLSCSSISTVANADFDNAEIKGSNSIQTSIVFGSLPLSSDQLYATASYKQHDLSNISWSGSGSGNLPGLSKWNFFQQNLAGDTFQNLNLSSTNFSGATFYASGTTTVIMNCDFTGANLSGANLSHILLLNVNLQRANLSNADFTGAIGGGIILREANLIGATFNLFNAGANDASDADFRGAIAVGQLSFVPEVGTNVIRSDGTIIDLSLGANELLVIRSYSIPITLATFGTSALALFSTSSTLEFDLDTSWSSIIHLDTNHVIPSLNGTLDLELAADVDPTTLVGTTFQLFAWDSPLAPGNQFATITAGPGLMFDTSNLYTDGTVTLTSAVAVPEPASLVTLLVGAAFLTCRGRRRGD